jgi:hypothetical protein
LMALSQALAWLCEPPQGESTLSWILRRAWPGFANLYLLNDGGNINKSL